jgi:LysM repeat protein
MERNAQNSSSRALLFLIGGAAILAIATFAIILALNSRPDEPQVDGATTGQQPGVDVPVDTPADLPASAIPYQVTIDNQLVTLYYVPEKEVRTQAERPQPAQPVVTEDPSPTPEPVAEQPTQDPNLLPTNTPVPVVVNQPSGPDSSQPQIILIAYTVAAGDTLYSIASAQSTSVSLMAVHGIDSEDIVAGNVLQLPVANAAYCPGYRTYVIKDGDTAFSVGHRFNTTHDVLRQINGLDANYSIRAGNVLCVP